jgi:signal peptidase I
MNEIDEKPAPVPAGDPANFPAGGETSDHTAADTGAAPVVATADTGPRSEPVAPPAPGKSDAKSGIADQESIIETVKTVVYALLIALVIRTFLFQPFNIPSGSMEATLLIGDYLFVEKFSYGYSQYSFPWGLGPISGRVWQGSGPHRGDVVVFKLPRDTSVDYIKRVIGLPGDRVQLIDGQIYLNGKAVPRVRAPDYVENDVLGTPHHITRFRETLPGGKSYLVLARDPGGTENNTDVYVVPQGHYFMMGDNRDNSLDSRFAPTGKGDAFDRSDGVGFVPAANLVGQAEFIFFSVDGSIFEFWDWPWTIRFSRMFTSID